MLNKAIAILLVLLVGCVTNCTQQTIQPKCYDNSTAPMQIDFNDENYVWEGFIFSTNRVDSIGK